MKEIPIIHSQLNPPPIRERFIRRGQVNQKLSSVPDYPLILLYAGAGYGKSTALALYVHDSNINACWYSISPNDDDIVPFLTKLTHSIKSVHPSFGHSIQKELASITTYVDTEKVYSLATAFVNEILDLQEEVYLIIDDFHHVKSSYEIEKWILFILEHIPANLHIVLSSRNKPKWDIIPILKVKGELYEISQEDLILSPSEMDYIVEDVLEISLSEEELTKIYQLTEGWAIAFNMLIQQIKDKEAISEILQNRQNTLEDLFDYLASEVLNKQSLIIQQFLLQSSVLEVLTPKDCDYILQIQGSEEILQGLLEQNLFVSEGERNAYRYHSLFKVFLENQLRTRYKAEFESLNNRAGHFYERRGNIETALYHYERITKYQKVASILKDYGEVMLQTGRLQSLYDLLLKLPSESKQVYPVLYYYQGEIERYRSLYEKAEKSYDRIISSVPEYDHEHYFLIGLAFEGKARIYLDTIQPDRAERFVKQAIHMRERANASKEEMAQLYHLMAENLLNLGQAGKAEAWFDRAKELDLPLEDGNLQARIYLRTGKLRKAKEILLERKANSNYMSGKHLPQSHRETDLLLSIITAFMGEAEESKKLASEGIQLGLSIKSPFVEACGWMRMGHAVQLLDQYDGKLAEKCYRTSLEIMEKINVSRGKAEPYMGLAILFGNRSEYERAVETAQKGLNETEKVKDKWLSSLIILGMTLTAVHNRKFDKALQYIEEVKQNFLECGDRYGLMVAAFWRAYIAHETQEDEHIFKTEMTLFLQSMNTEGYEFFLKKQTTFGPKDMQNIAPLLLKAKQLEILPQLVTKYSLELNLDETLKNHPGYTLKVHTLGHLRVWIGSKPIESKDWQREKAKELFELFITNRKKWLAKEQIFQYLWPDQDEEAANKNFKVTFNALLKALEPKRKAREESFFILRKGSSYGLNPDSFYELDTENFEEWINQGIEEKEPKRAIELLERGLKLYKGDYLEDLRLAEWCLQEREHYQLIFLRGAEKLAQSAVRIQDFHTCIEWCERMIAIDHTWEEAYRLLMFSYYHLNNRPQAIRWYEKCCHVLENELGVEPMAPTEEMYHLIMESEELNSY
ncbi:BTAD domain-containing putative transcriptional regulator [Ornithinibacillus halophilus]|uniref:Transcriptional regulator n=1 Tax=Ornithinibacillus halophilus TaxID=930117 RepID=A0A1M5HCU0_9BACI|nr:BTAD domain-containing putative transcriptional regulator [Ornithinibacillus halophilus]SHG13721.1 transcriptional regulator [Ornithinibacillus halophilus]